MRPLYLPARALRFFLNNIYCLLSPLIRYIEDFYINVRGGGVKDPVFIIGAPRTGSTILYQALTNNYNFSYIDNFSCMFCRNLRFGMWLSHKLYSQVSHNNFESEHGNTSKYGLHAPSECGEFWYRWLPSDRHYVDPNDITQDDVFMIRKEVLGVTKLSNKPFLFKNLNAGQRLKLIKKIFPGAKFIFLRRDPRFVVKSILAARTKDGIEEHKWWSIKPRNYSELLSLREKEMCVAQVFYLERQIIEDLSLFSAENVRVINYQDLSFELVSEIADWLDVTAKKNIKFPEFTKDKLSSLSCEDLIMLNKLISKYDFDEELIFEK